jgi:hypothetical protein
MSDASWQPAGLSVYTTDNRIGRTKITKRDADTDIRVTMRRDDWIRAELVFKVETADKCGRVNISVKRRSGISLRLRVREKDRPTRRPRPSYPGVQNRLGWSRTMPAPVHACSPERVLGDFGAD